jgi:hypothetical protein
MAGLGLPLGFERLNSFPLDYSSVFETLNDLQNYVSSDPIAYEGQICYAKDENKSYVIVDILGALALQEVGAGSSVVENVVYTTGDQSVSGIKTFVDGINVGNPSTPTTNTLYVRSGEVGINNDDPQGALDVSGLALFSERPQVNGTGVLLSGDINLASLVYTTGNQVISGIKTFAETGVFSSGIIVSGSALFDQRPTVNGSGVLLQGDILAGAGELFTGDINVSIPNGTSFGKYADGSKIEASGKSPKEVILMACFSAKDPTLSFIADTIPFGFSGDKVLDLKFNYTINSFGGTPALIKIQTKKATDPDTEWEKPQNILRDETSNFTASPITQTHSINHTLYDTTNLQYRFTVEDNLGGKKIQDFTLTPAPYVAPSVKDIVVGTVATPNTPSLVRYRGDSGTNYKATIDKNTNLVKITSYGLQRKINSGGGSSWESAGSTTNVTTNPSSVSVNLSDNVLLGDASYSSVKNANTISYRLVITDEYQDYLTSSLGLPTNGTLINFYHKVGIIYSSALSLSLNNIDTATAGSSNLILQASKSRQMSVSAPEEDYTYYLYDSSQGNLSSITVPGANDFTDSFEKKTNITGTNLNGASVNYIVYRTSSRNAFTDVTLLFT